VKIVGIYMKADPAICGRGISGNGYLIEIPGMRAVYTSADEQCHLPPDDIKQALDACRALNADVTAVESSDRVIVAAVNCYDNTYAAAICDPGIQLPAIARSLQMRLISLSVPDARPDVLPATTVRSYTGLWERKIAAVFGEQYAAGLVTAMAPVKAPDAVSIDDLEQMRMRLTSILGGCLDLPKVDRRTIT
ncbi:MAG: hypothetical protein WBZ29_15415, partial [Methanocella sp.]